MKKLLLFIIALLCSCASKKTIEKSQSETNDFHETEKTATVDSVSLSMETDTLSFAREETASSDTHISRIVELFEEGNLSYRETTIITKVATSDISTSHQSKKESVKKETRNETTQEESKTSVQNLEEKSSTPNVWRFPWWILLILIALFWSFKIVRRLTNS